MVPSALEPVLLASVSSPNVRQSLAAPNPFVPAMGRYSDPNGRKLVNSIGEAQHGKVIVPTGQEPVARTSRGKFLDPRAVAKLPLLEGCGGVRFSAGLT